MRSPVIRRFFSVIFIPVAAEIASVSSSKNSIGGYAYPPVKQRPKELTTAAKSSQTLTIIPLYFSCSRFAISGKYLSLKRFAIISSKPISSRKADARR